LARRATEWSHGFRPHWPFTRRPTAPIIAVMGYIPECGRLSRCRRARFSGRASWCYPASPPRTPAAVRSRLAGSRGRENVQI
jgi:hypothetical protein